MWPSIHVAVWARGSFKFFAKVHVHGRGAGYSERIPPHYGESCFKVILEVKGEGPRFDNEVAERSIVRWSLKEKEGKTLPFSWILPQRV